MIVCLIFIIVCLVSYSGLLSGCKPPRLSMSGGSGLLGTASSRETVNEKEYFVRNTHYRPAYFEYEDWGIVVLAVVDVTDGEPDVKPYHITGTVTSKHIIQINVKSIEDITCQWEKDCFIVCYNDESGNCYKARLEMDDPRAACLFYRSDNKKRKELVDLWHQLNKEKDNHTIIFEAP